MQSHLMFMCLIKMGMKVDRFVIRLLYLAIVLIFITIIRMARVEFMILILLMYLVDTNQFILNCILWLMTVFVLKFVRIFMMMKACSIVRLLVVHFIFGERSILAHLTFILSLIRRFRFLLLISLIRPIIRLFVCLIFPQLTR